jgi:hypothetical protein
MDLMERRTRKTRMGRHNFDMDFYENREFDVVMWHVFKEV